MALDINYLSQLQTYAVAMKTYYKGLQDNLTSYTNPLPMFMDIVGTFDYSEILRHALNNQQSSANFISGSLVDTVHDMMAVQREFDIRNKSRSFYLVDSISDYALDSNYYDAFYAINLNLFKGTSPDQA